MGAAGPETVLTGVLDQPGLYGVLAYTVARRTQEICAAIGPTLREQGMIFVGIDVIGDYLTEINVTSPTGLQEIARFDGVRYGYRAPEYSDLIDMYKKTRAQGFGAEVKRRILVGTYVLSHGYYDAYYIKAQKLRRLIAQDFVAAFKKCDVIMGPTTPSTAFRIGEKAGDPVQMYLSDIYTIAVNLAGLPGLSIPAGFGDKNHPVGLQLIGNYFAEAKMLNIAHQFQQVTDWHLRLPPGVEDKS